MDGRGGVGCALDGTAERRQRVGIAAVGLVAFALEARKQIFERSIGHRNRAALYRDKDFHVVS